MRALDTASLEVLRGDYRCADLGSRVDADLFAVMRGLARRGCLREADEDGRINFYMTDLGRLALRVAVAIPPVQP